MTTFHSVTAERSPQGLMPQPVERYNFRCEDNFGGTREVFNPGVDGSFLGPLFPSRPNLLSCDCLGQGVRPKPGSQDDLSTPILESLNNISSLQHHFDAFNASGFSIDLWVTLSHHGISRHSSGDNLPTSPLVSIAGKSDSVANGSFLGCDGYEFRLVQSGPYLHLSYADDDASRSCRRITIEISEPFSSAPAHVVISFSTSVARVFVNAKSVLPDTRHFFDVKLRNWDQTYTFQLFSGPKSFRGSVHWLALYDQPVSIRDAELLFREGHEFFVNVTQQPPFGLLATPSNSFSLVQGRTDETAIWIGGTFVSRDECRVALEILSLPTHGELFVVDVARPVPVGSILALEHNASRQQIYYSSSSADYFNAPNKSANGLDLDLPMDSFDFRVIVTHPRTKKLLGASAAVSQPIRVLNVNHKPVLVAPTLVSPGVVTSASQPLPINGFYLVDADRNVDKIRVDVLAKRGALSLSGKHWHLADFHSCRNRTYSSWQCHGSGTEDRSMTFVAVPGDVSLILEGMLYHILSREAADEIVVRVFDGVDGGCLTDVELPRYTDNLGNSYASVKHGCQQVEAVVRIDLQFDDPSRDSFHLPAVFIWVILGLFFLCVALCLKCLWGFCTRRGKSVPARAMVE